MPKKELFMANRLRPNLLLSLAAIALAATLGGCVAYPAYPTYGAGYGYGRPYYGGVYVAPGGGWRGYDGWHDRDGYWRR
jgi:hypothetical protein